MSVCCTHPPSRVPSPSLEIGYADRRLGGASVWFIHNPNAISISYTYLVNVQQLVFLDNNAPHLSRTVSSLTYV